MGCWDNSYSFLEEAGLKNLTSKCFHDTDLPEPISNLPEWLLFLLWLLLLLFLPSIKAHQLFH